MSTITRALSRDGSARIFVINSTDIVAEAARLHNTSKTATAALGRALTGASLMGTLLKNPTDALTLQIRGEGPGGTIICVSDYMGNVRGCMDHPEAELPPNAAGKLDVGGLVGPGMLYVIRDLGMAEPYIGMTPLVSGEIAEDITSYFAASEQTPSVCALGVRVSQDRSVKSAGGFLAQLMPGADEDVVGQLEENCRMLPSVSALLAEGKSNLEVIDTVFRNIPYDVFDEFDASYRCNCSRERYLDAVSAMGPTDLFEILKDGKPVETQCHFCGKKYVFTKDEILTRREERKKAAAEAAAEDAGSEKGGADPQ